MTGPPKTEVAAPEVVAPPEAPAPSKGTPYSQLTIGAPQTPNPTQTLRCVACPDSVDLTGLPFLWGG